MSDHDEKLGYILAKLEGLEGKFSKHSSDNVDSEGKLSQRMDILEEKLDKILERTQTIRGMLLLLKFLGTTVFLLLALKFGDIRTAWEVFKAAL